MRGWNSPEPHRSLPPGRLASLSAACTGSGPLPIVKSANSGARGPGLSGQNPVVSSTGPGTVRGWRGASATGISPACTRQRAGWRKQPARYVVLVIKCIKVRADKSIHKHVRETHS